MVLFLWPLQVILTKVLFQTMSARSGCPIFFYLFGQRDLPFIFSWVLFLSFDS